MSVSVSVPEDLYEKAAAIAKALDLSVDDVFTSAFAEHLAAWERLKRRAANGCVANSRSETVSGVPVLFRNQ